MKTLSELIDELDGDFRKLLNKRTHWVAQSFGGNRPDGSSNKWPRGKGKTPEEAVEDLISTIRNNRKVEETL